MMRALEPYLGAIKAAVLMALALGLFGAGHRFGAQSVQVKWDADKLIQAQAAQKAEAAARAKEQSMTKQLEDAQNAAKERESKLLADADTARAESSRLRDNLNSIRAELPQLTEQAVRRYADAASVVLGECTAKYQELAATADRIDNDRQTLMDAWPK